MKINYTVHHSKYTKLDDVKQTCKEVKAYYKKLGTEINFKFEKEYSIDERDKSLYKLDLSHTLLEFNVVKSISTDIMKELYTEGNGVILFADKRRARETSSLRGQYARVYIDSIVDVGLIEVYSKPKYGVKKVIKDNKTYYVDTKSKLGRLFERDTYVLIHEIAHDIERRVLGTDKLHNEVANGNFENYLGYINDRISPKETVKTVNSMDVVELTKFKLQPIVERKIKLLFYLMAILQSPMRVVEGTRSVARQNKLYNQVPKVTNARGGESFHQYGVAVDCNFLRYGYNAPTKLWKRFGFFAKMLGFKWGGDWEGFTDKPHLELTFDYTIKDFINNKVDYDKYK